MFIDLILDIFKQKASVCGIAAPKPTDFDLVVFLFSRLSILSYDCRKSVQPFEDSELFLVDGF